MKRPLASGLISGMAACPSNQVGIWGESTLVRTDGGGAGALEEPSS
eukprot:COSAG01_NODE_1248_length_11071_cov_30.622676_9_plen_46_part_00